MIPLRATVRLQLHRDFGFADAAAQVDYFAALGISHLYLSPIAQAVPGSTHGYDNIDPAAVSADLGGEAGLRTLADRARGSGLGLLLDIVPNHMAADTGNRWWCDVLRHGRRSAHADWFDIEWDAPGCDGRLWLPLLDRPLADALATGVLTLEVEAEGPCLRHHGLRLPLSPLSFPASPAAWPEWAARCRRSPQRLHALLQRQAYRLAWWRSGGDKVNYRRFFDISSLVALRVEREDVFTAVHALPLRLAAEGLVDGLRIDHVDGLADPAGYLRRLRTALDGAGARRGLAPGTLSLHVEKILADGEALPADWACDGTTGYDFMDQVAAVLHATDAEAPLQALWRSFSGDTRDFDAVQQQARRQMLAGTLRSDRDRCLRVLQAAVADDPHSADLTPAMFERALGALLQHFPVYRSYGLRSAADLQRLGQAEAAAAAGLDGGDRAALARLVACLADGTVDNVPRQRFEQLCAPLNAKAVEDTAFYRYARLLSRNEVGSDPRRVSLSPQAFVSLAQARGEHWPRAMLALATHDHKRGPDARCRLAVLSWNVAAWERRLQAWRTLAAQAGRGCPLPGGEAMMLWQTLLSSWPLQATDADDGYLERLGQWLRKALREGKRISSWAEPDDALETAVLDWLAWLLRDAAAGPLRQDIAIFVAQLAPRAARLGLVQLALQLCVPGVPDLYQGNEGWDLSLVDPDNRRPVDYRQRRAWLAAPRDWNAALLAWQDGRPKAQLLAELLQLRRAQPALFARAPLVAAGGEHGAGVQGLLRVLDEAALLLVVDVEARLQAPGGLQGLRRGDAGASIAWPAAALPGGHWRNVLDGRRHAIAEDTDTRTLLDGSPVAVWIREPGETGGR